MSPLSPSTTLPKLRKGGRIPIVAAALLSLVALPMPAAGAAPLSYVSEAALLRDSMSRAAGPGWGTSENGVRYTSSWLPALSVAGGRAKVDVPTAGSSRTVEAAVTPAVDIGASYTAAVSTQSTSGEGVYSGLQVRHLAGSFYQGTVRFLPGGKAALDISRTNGTSASNKILAESVILPFTVGAKQQVNLEVQATGTSPVEVKARAWVPGTVVPGWQ